MEPFEQRKGYTTSAGQALIWQERCHKDDGDKPQQIHQEANEQLNSLRDRAAVYRIIIKQNYLQDQWAGFGLQDKR